MRSLKQKKINNKFIMRQIQLLININLTYSWEVISMQGSTLGGTVCDLSVIYLQFTCNSSASKSDFQMRLFRPILKIHARCGYRSHSDLLSCTLRTCQLLTVGANINLKWCFSLVQLRLLTQFDMKNLKQPISFSENLNFIMVYIYSLFITKCSI